MTQTLEIVKVETTMSGYGRVLLSDGSVLSGVLGVDVEVRPGSLPVLMVRVPAVAVDVVGFEVSRSDEGGAPQKSSGPRLLDHLFPHAQKISPFQRNSANGWSERS